MFYSSNHMPQSHSNRRTVTPRCTNPNVPGTTINNSNRRTAIIFARELFSAWPGLVHVRDVTAFIAQATMDMRWTPVVEVTLSDGTTVRREARASPRTLIFQDRNEATAVFER